MKTAERMVWLLNATDFKAKRPFPCSIYPGHGKSIFILHGLKLSEVAFYSV